MSDAETSANVLPGLLRVAERAKRVPEAQMLALAHHVDEALMTAAYRRIRKDAAVGVDGVTKEQYGERLEDNLRALHTRMREGRYRHQPIRRVHIPKAPGKTRPIGISTIEDKIVQNALTMVLEVVYEPVFLDCSYGFRPGRSAHDALRTVNAACTRGEVSWVLEADIESFFDHPRSDDGESPAIDGKEIVDKIEVAIAVSLLQRADLGDDAIRTALAVGAANDPLEAITAVERAAPAG